MPGRLYPANVGYILEPSTNWEGLTVRAAMVTALFEYDSADTVLSDIPPPHIVGTSGPLEGPTLSGDLVASGPPFEWAAFLSPLQVAGVVFYADFGDPAYSPLLAFYPTDQLIGVPFAPAGLQYFLYPSADLPGFFQVFDDDIEGSLSTRAIASGFALAELEGGLTAAFPDLLLSGTLSEREKACMPADAEDNCCAPDIRSTLCE